MNEDLFGDKYYYLFNYLYLFQLLLTTAAIQKEEIDKIYSRYYVILILYS